MSESSDDDIPIAELMKRKNLKKSDEGKSESTSNDTEKKSNSTDNNDGTIPKLDIKKQKEPKNVKSPASKKIANDTVENKVSQSKQNDEEDSDDDIPISELLKKRASQKVSAPPPAPSSKTLPSKEKPVSNKPVVKKSIASTKKSTDSSNTAVSNKRKVSSITSSSKYESFYEETKKGFLVQTLLRRWWYAIKWPAEGQQFNAPPGYEPLEGFRGVYVCTSTANLGHILDLRDRSTCPCLINLSKKGSAELKALARQAILEQVRQLREAEGADSRLEAKLRAELKLVDAVDVAKADKEGAKYRF